MDRTYCIRAKIMVNDKTIDAFIYDTDEVGSAISLFTYEKAVNFVKNTISRPEFVEMTIIDWSHHSKADHEQEQVPR